MYDINLTQYWRNSNSSRLRKTVVEGIYIFNLMGLNSHPYDSNKLFSISIVFSKHTIYNTRTSLQQTSPIFSLFHVCVYVHVYLQLVKDFLMQCPAILQLFVFGKYFRLKIGYTERKVILSILHMFMRKLEYRQFMYLFETPVKNYFLYNT